MKSCTRCNIDKPFNRYTKDKSTKDGLSRWCKDCKALSDKRYRTGPGGFKRDETIVREIDEKLFANGKTGRGSGSKRSDEERLEAYKKSSKQLVHSHPSLPPQKSPEGKIRAKDLRYRRQYGITLEQYDEMYAEQEGKCWICMESLENLCVDHCHSNGTVRKLLCSNCNSGLGFFKDNVVFMKRAIKYLNLYMVR